MPKKQHQPPILITAVAALLISGCVYPSYDGEKGAALEEQQSVWQYLNVYSIYQDRVPRPPLGSMTPYDMFDRIHDTLRGGRYTDYLEDRPGGGVLFPPDTEFEDPWPITDSTVYFYLPEFSKPALAAFNASLPTLALYPNIIIDVCNNGGGYLNVADAILGELLPPRTKYIKNRYRWYNSRKYAGETVEDTSFTTTPRPSLLNKRVAVLINGYSASASEILAAGLKDGTNGRAYLIGNKSYGKGIGQAVFDRADGRKGLIITFLEICGITNRTGQYHRVGIAPDTVPAPIVSEVDARIPSQKQWAIIQDIPDTNIQKLLIKELRDLYYALKLLEPGFTFPEEEEIVDGMGKRRGAGELAARIHGAHAKAKARWRPMGAVVIDEKDLPNMKLSGD